MYFSQIFQGKFFKAKPNPQYAALDIMTNYDLKQKNPKPSLITYNGLGIVRSECIKCHKGLFF